MDDALAELDRADRGAEPAADSLKLRGSISMQQRNWAAAAATLQKAIAMSPGDAELHAWQGHTQMELRNYELAESELKRSLTLDPKPPDLAPRILRPITPFWPSLWANRRPCLRH